MLIEQIIKENVKIDNVSGMGAVPNNQEVDYLGLRVKMPPFQFLQLAEHLPKKDTEEMEKEIAQGESIAAPFLIVEIPDSWADGDFSEPARVVGHEGRHRMQAVKNLYGRRPVETHIFFTGGLRRRHLTDEMIQELQQRMVMQNSDQIVAGKLFEI